jgi:hypothetical protein
MTQPHPWRKSTFSTAGNDCVELAQAGDVVLIRDSKHPAGGHLRFNRTELVAFVAACKASEFDDLA